MEETLKLNISNMVTIKRYVIFRFSRANGGVYSLKIPHTDNNYAPKEVRRLSDFILKYQLFVFADDSPLVKLEQAVIQSILQIPIIF